MTRRYGLALLAGLLSCAGPEAPQAPAPSQQAPITNGAVNQSSAYETIGMLYNYQPGNPNAGGTSCTATLIAPNVVLTAAHCAFGEPSTPGTAGPFVDIGNGWDALFIMDWDANNAPFDNYVHVRKYYPNSNYDPSALTNDVAIAVLDRDVTADGASFSKVWPIANNHVPDFDPGGGNHTLLFIGYGITASGGSDSGTRRSVNSTQADVNDASNACYNVTYPPPQGNFYASSQFCFSDYNTYGSGAHGTCQGDSGGPALASIGGVQTVVGITSYGSGSDCREYGVDTRVDYFAAWINQQVGSKAGLAEKCGDGQDNDGDGKPDCQDPDCEGSPLCPNGVITAAGNCQACNATTPCQTGLVCVKSSAGASNGICQTICASTCSGTASCGTFLDDNQACTCPGQQLVADGASCYYNHYCHTGSKCVQGFCQPRCDDGYTCAAGLLCNALTHVCEAPATTASSSSGTTSSTTAGGTTAAGSTAAGSTAGASTAASTSAAGSTGGSPGSTAAGSTAGSTAAGSTAGGSTTGEPTTGAAGTTSGGDSGGFGGNAGAGAGAGTTSGTTGSQAPAKTGIFGCSSASGAGLLPLLALAGLRRRRRS